MRSQLFSLFSLGCIVSTLVACQAEPTRERRKSRPITTEQPTVSTPADFAPITPNPIAPSTEVPMPVTETIVEERGTLSCTSSFGIPRSQDARLFSAEAEVSNLDQNKVMELARFKNEIVELTSNLGTLTLSKRSSDAPAAYVARATMNAPLFALLDESSDAPATVFCETTKPMPVEGGVRFQCDAEIASKNDGTEKITAKRDTTLSLEGDERRVPLAELDDLRLVAYANQGEITLAVETLAGDWIGAAVGTIADAQFDGEFTLGDAIVKGSCRRLP